MVKIKDFTLASKNLGGTCPRAYIPTAHANNEVINRGGGHVPTHSSVSKHRTTMIVIAIGAASTFLERITRIILSMRCLHFRLIYTHLWLQR